MGAERYHVLGRPLRDAGRERWRLVGHAVDVALALEWSERFTAARASEGQTWETQVVAESALPKVPRLVKGARK